MKLIGTAADTGAVSSKPRFDKTQSYWRVRPSFEERIATDSGVDDERNVFLDVTGLFDRDDSLEEAIGLARTWPALAPQPGLDVSGVRARERLQLRLEPTDHVAAAVGRSHTQPAGSPTLRVTALARSPLSRAWRVWDRQPAFIAISTAAAICFMSVLAARLLLP